MATPEVKVRLTAEGVEGVVGAFRRIGNEATTAGKKGKAAFDPLGSSLATIKSLLPALGFAAAAAALKSLSTSALALTDNLSETADRLGISTKFLQQMNFAAVKAGTGVDTMGQALTYLSKNIAQAASEGRPLIEFLDGTSIAARNADGSVRGVEEVMLDILAVFPRIQDGAGLGR